jgi:hypothetical protein
VINEHYINLQKNNLQADISTVVHEILHALYFHPNLFKIYPKNYLNENFYYQENSQIYLRGANLIKTAKKHFDCPTLSKSIYY